MHWLWIRVPEPYQKKKRTKQNKTPAGSLGRVTRGSLQPEQRVHMGLGVGLLRPPTGSGANKFLAEQVCVGGLIIFQH